MERFCIVFARRKLRQALDKDSVLLHISLHSRSPVLVEKLKDVPLDFAYIDTEHSPINWETLENMMRAADLIDLPILVRVEEEGFFDQVRKCLELGAQGIILSHASSKLRVEEAIRAAKFPPVGSRGMSAVRPFYVSPDFYQSNRDTIIYLMIEEPEGVDNIDEILSVKGVDIAGVARNDFSLAAGCPGQLEDPIVEEAVMKVITHAKEAGVAPMVQYWATGSKVKRYVDAGARVISLGSDHDLLKQKCAETVDQVRKLLR
jgi:2-keto-3-deoxy-L-rhamnonate aldolase RhmA